MFSGFIEMLRWLNMGEVSFRYEVLPKNPN